MIWGFVVLYVAFIALLWHTWCHGGDGQRFYRSMGWTHPWIVQPVTLTRWRARHRR